ncbi:MAG TPA: NAD(P)-dependent oxidoreductase [Bradyrhizobium sp.]|nr:NAD(P)-dependent oxidoreductase [Bradyrhizobium sp.]
MRSAIISGGRGFVGRHLVKALRRRGVIVRTLGRTQSEDPADTTHIVLAEEGWESDELGCIIEHVRPDCIFHLAGRARGTPDELTRANLGLMQSLLRTLRRIRMRPRLIVAGSAAEYGGAIRDGEPVAETAICAPLSPYGISKHAQTREALAFADATATSVLVARIFNPLGPGMPTHLAIGDFADQIASMRGHRGTLQVGNLDVCRDMIDIEHAATLLCQLAENCDACGVVNVCSGQAPLLRELVDLLIDGCGKKIDIRIDWSRIRGNEPYTILGSTDRLAELGCSPPQTEFTAVIARVCRDIADRRAQKHDQATLLG